MPVSSDTSGSLSTASLSTFPGWSDWRQEANSHLPCGDELHHTSPAEAAVPRTLLTLQEQVGTQHRHLQVPPQLLHPTRAWRWNSQQK